MPIINDALKGIAKAIPNVSRRMFLGTSAPTAAAIATRQASATKARAVNTLNTLYNQKLPKIVLNNTIMPRRSFMAAAPAVMSENTRLIPSLEQGAAKVDKAFGRVGINSGIRPYLVPGGFAGAAALPAAAYAFGASAKKIGIIPQAISDHMGEIFGPLQGGRKFVPRSSPVYPTSEDSVKAGHAVKLAAPKWIQLLRSGALSPAALQKITTAMPPGRHRFVKPLGKGSYQQADLLAGNMAGQPGLMARKIPLKQLHPETFDNYKTDLLDTSKILEKQFPGNFAQYRSDPKVPGILQDYGVGDPFKGTWPNNPGNFYSNGVPNVPKPIIDKISDIRRVGVQDLHMGNFGPKGQIIDFQMRNPNTGRLAGDALIGRPIDSLRGPLSTATDLSAVRKYWLGKGGANFQPGNYSSPSKVLDLKQLKELPPSAPQWPHPGAATPTSIPEPAWTGRQPGRAAKTKIPKLLGGGAALAALAGGGYGAYKAYSRD